MKLVRDHETAAALDGDDEEDAPPTQRDGEPPWPRGLVIAGAFPHLPPVPRFAPNLGLVRRHT